MTKPIDGQRSDELIETYAARIIPLLELAKRAYGSRAQSSAAHEASREYTRLLIEYKSLGGSLVTLAPAVNTTYGAMRRRIATASAPPTNRRPNRVVKEQTDAAVARVLAARAEGGANAFHTQLAIEYDNGASLSAIASQMGIKGSAGLYYGMQRARSRAAEVS